MAMARREIEELEEEESEEEEKEKKAGEEGIRVPSPEIMINIDSDEPIFHSLPREESSYPVFHGDESSYMYILRALEDAKQREEICDMEARRREEARDMEARARHLETSRRLDAIERKLGISSSSRSTRASSLPP